MAPLDDNAPATTKPADNGPSSAPETPWHAAYPEARNKDVPSITRADLLDWIKHGKKPGRDFVLVDLRRADHEGGTIFGSINLPAQSLYPTIPALYSLFRAAGVPTVVWYCGSSRGRGNRAAAWFADHIEDQGDPSMRSVVLLEGVRGWASAGSQYTQLMHEYVPEKWQK